ncbi:MAG: N-methyl-L-tryptophan oxidase [Chloroflexota bacterium]|nr:N-methyl-L-tryptophan oxidase [Chloroflexota bacterium]
MTDRHTDVLVLGGGTMGTAAGWAVARRGHSVRVAEQFDHIHALGSHGGITRIFRHAYAEGADYVPWALRADDEWMGLQERTGESILHRVGCLDMSAPGYSWAQQAREAADAHSLGYDWIDGREIRRRFPAWNVPDDFAGCYTADAGYLLVEPALRAMATEMQEAGGMLQTHCRVNNWSVDGDGVRIESARGTFTADRLIVTGGAWNIHLLTPLGLPLEVRRKPIFWFESERPQTITPDALPCWIAEYDDGNAYGLPQVEIAGAKAGMHSGGETADPEELDREVHPHDLEAAIGPFMRRYMNGITGRLISSAVCMYTMTPDEDFVIDRHPEHSNVAFAAGFSGHGFKFAPVAGQHLADLVLDSSTEVRPLFAMRRFAGGRAG